MEMQKSVILVKKKFEKKYVNDKKYCKGRDHCYYKEMNRRAVNGICNLKYSVPKKIHIAFIMDLNMNIILS